MAFQYETVNSESMSTHYHARSLSFVGFFLLLGAVYTAFCSDDSNDDDLDLGDTIKVPSGADDCEGKNYQAIETLFKSAGFSNIACVPLNDLSTGWMKKPGTVDSVTINGQEQEEWKEKYLPTAAIVITYHSFAK